MKNTEMLEKFVKIIKEYATVDNLSLDGKELVYIEDIDNILKDFIKCMEE